MMYLKLERVKDSLVTFRVTFDQDQILAECKRQEAIKVSTKLKCQIVILSIRYLTEHLQLFLFL